MFWWSQIWEEFSLSTVSKRWRILSLGETRENDFHRKSTQHPLMYAIRKVTKGSMENYIVVQIPR